jgi:beta-glucosidase
MQRPRPGAAFAAALTACISLAPARAGETVRCASFADEPLSTPTPSQYPSAVERAKRISQEVKSARYSIIFFGDSLTEGWNRTVWEEHLAPRGALNAGVSGDRTDNLLWRLHHGNLDGPRPDAVVLLIGTNDLAYGRSSSLTADGIRANLDELRRHFRNARILLLGLLPREESPAAPLRAAAAEVNHLIRDCADDRHVIFADIGEVLLDSNGRLTTAIAPDGLHFSALAYSLLASRLDPELERLLGALR